MIITVNSGGGNLANYLLYGNKNSRDTDKIVILDGNAKLTDRLSKSMECDDKHFHFIFSVNGKRNDEDMRLIYKDFKKELLHSYSKDEVNVLSVLHQDTNNSHIHIQVPKLNLLTNTKLDIYYDKRDRKRFETIRDYLNLKYKEALPSIPSKSNPTKNWKYNPRAIKTKKEKLEFENKLLDNLFDNRNKFNSHNELIQYIREDLKIDVQKVGYDYKKDDFYITIKHTDDKKSQRIFSPLFNDGKSKYIANEDGQKEYVKYDFNTTPLEKQIQTKQQESLNTLRIKLDKMQAVEKARIDKRLGRMKPLAQKRVDSPKKDITPPPIKSVPTPPINFKDLKKESSLENDAHTFKQLQQLKQINLAEITTKEYNFKFLERSDKFDFIEDINSHKKLFVYRDDDGYKYINPYNQKEKGDIGNFLKSSSKIGTYGTIIDLINPLKAYISMFKDLLKIGEMALEMTLNTLIDKDLVDRDESISNKKSNRVKTPSIRGADLKPY